MNEDLLYDPIIEEIHKKREQIADKFNGDLAAILADARERQAASGRPIWAGKRVDGERQSA